MEFFKILYDSFILIFSFNLDLYEIIFLSIRTSLFATIIASFLGIITAYYLANNKSNLFKIITLFLNSLTGIPPVVAGLIVFFIFSDNGPFGIFNIIYSPTAMVIAQIIIVYPIISSLIKELFEEFYFHYSDSLKSYNMKNFTVIYIFIKNNHYMVLTILLTAFGRAISEVGAVMIVGGNIEHYTRVMTSAISLETSMGNLEKAMSLGIILILITLIINFFSFKLNKRLY
ncbi:MAG: Tungstate uptake system permease protein TupB [Alphaproteobacteria bacterium MarineAlpha5_Bin12]|nr:ABC transporter permease [Pelagibacteraceae bacterium]MBI04195.1 ABC transporter permease [Pelagibacteraceae bacterium]PPR42133.1 MAG: Tungstate uptake system permease protein TupB [Alphaproteobacteria bacterium MarineAlpha5_Bin12]|tara:strand:+ start:4545 stop:5234 length:690 start_codon:yes stop_codon:yes gene_type:complete